MKYAYSVLTVAAVLGLSVSTPALAEKAAPATKAQTQTTAKADANAQEPGFFDKMKGWFEPDANADAQAKAHAKTEPAAGETQAPRKRTTTTINAKRPAAPSANDTNPYLGRVLTEGGADIGIRTNAQMGGGAGGNYGNQ